MATALIMLLCVWMVSGCVVSQQTKEQRKAEEAVRAKMIKKILPTKQFRVTLSEMYPRRGAPQSINRGYEVVVMGDRVESWIPYLGMPEVMQVGTTRGFRFTEAVKDYQVTNASADLSKVKVELDHEGNTYEYYFEIYSDGSAELEIRSRDRESIRYRGEMVLPEVNVSE